MSTLRGLTSVSEPGARIGYVLKVFPRFSETFILNELLAHERAGLDLEIFSLHPPIEGRFHEALARLAAPVTYVERKGIKAETLWEELSAGSAELPGFAEGMRLARGSDARDVYQALVVARTALARGIGHLHAHFASSATTVTRLAARFAGVPYSFTAHAKDIFHESVSRADVVDKIGEAAAVVTVSDYNHKLLCRMSTGTPVERVYNGLELERFPYADPADRPPVIAGVGRLVEKKGFGDLIDACAQLAVRGQDFRCRIVGSGPLEADLRDQIRRLRLADRVEMLGPRSQDEVRRILAEAAVMAVPCVIAGDGNRDGLPTVLVEAMALGTPCVSTDVTGIPELVEHERTGLIVPQRAPAALADALGRLLEDRSLRRALALAARRRIDADFDVDRNTVALRALFHSPPARAERDQEVPHAGRLRKR